MKHTRIKRTLATVLIALAIAPTINTVSAGVNFKKIDDAVFGDDQNVGCKAAAKICAGTSLVSGATSGIIFGTLKAQQKFTKDEDKKAVITKLLKYLPGFAILKKSGRQAIKDAWNNGHKILAFERTVADLLTYLSLISGAGYVGSRLAPLVFKNSEYDSSGNDSGDNPEEDGDNASGDKPKGPNPEEQRKMDELDRKRLAKEKKQREEERQTNARQELRDGIKMCDEKLQQMEQGTYVLEGELPLDEQKRYYETHKEMCQDSLNLSEIVFDESGEIDLNWPAEKHLREFGEYAKNRVTELEKKEAEETEFFGDQALEKIVDDLAKERHGMLGLNQKPKRLGKRRRRPSSAHDKTGRELDELDSTLRNLNRQYHSGNDIRRELRKRANKKGPRD